MEYFERYKVRFRTLVVSQQHVFQLQKVWKLCKIQIYSLDVNETSFFGTETHVPETQQVSKGENFGACRISAIHISAPKICFS